MPIHRDPRTNAADRAGLDPGQTRVLEPSPPAVDQAPFFADDPAAIDGTALVGPTSAAPMPWSVLVADKPELASFCRANWLIDDGELPSIPERYVDGRRDAHRLAYSVVAEARRASNGRFGLRWTKGGFGTPFFAKDSQVRIEGTNVVVQVGDAIRFEPITTLGAAANFVGVKASTDAAEEDSPPLGDLDRPLELDGPIVAFLDDWFGFAWSVLEELRTIEGGVDVGRTQLWPGHFDPAVEIGDADSGGRATYGASPGDDQHPEPYLYVGVWGDIDDDESFWNASSFKGATLGFDRFGDSGQPAAEAQAFFATAHGMLNPGL
jgi:hypothetical protein